jgi:hypothetical protein
LLAFLLRDALSLLSGLREPDRYGLLSAFNFAAFPTPGRFSQCPAYSAASRFLRRGPRWGSICASFSLPLSLLHFDEVHLSPSRFSHKKLRNVCPTARNGIRSMSMSGRLNSSFFRRFDRYDSETGKRSAASSACLLQYSAKKSSRAIYKRPPRERSHLCDVFLPTIRRVLPNEGGSNVQSATAAAVLVALSVPVYAAGDFSHGSDANDTAARGSHRYRLVQAECL